MQVDAFVDFDGRNRSCMAHYVIARVADKWALCVIDALAAGTKRHGELQRIVRGVSPKMLTQTLRMLEANGFLTRRSFAEVPPRVEYSLTPLGVSFIEPLNAIRAWAEEHVDELQSARANAEGYARGAVAGVLG